jgi:hypothetical protein
LARESEHFGFGDGIAAEIGPIADAEIFEMAEAHRDALGAAARRRKAWQL